MANPVVFMHPASPARRVLTDTRPGRVHDALADQAEVCVSQLCHGLGVGVKELDLSQVEDWEDRVIGQLNLERFDIADLAVMLGGDWQLEEVDLSSMGDTTLRDLLVYFLRLAIVQRIGQFWLANRPGVVVDLKSHWNNGDD